MRHATLFLPVILIVVAAAAADVFNERYDDWPAQTKIAGTIIVGDARTSPASVRRAHRRVGPAERVVFLFDDGMDDPLVAPFREALGRSETSSVVERTLDRLGRQLRGVLEECDLLFWHSAAPLTPERRAAIAEAADAFQDHVRSGGVIIALGAHAEALARYGPDPAPPGLGLLPDVALELHHDPAARGALLAVLARHPRAVGVGLAPETVLLLGGRRILTFGPGSATFLLMANERQPLRVQTIAQRRSRRQLAGEHMIDLTEWRRDAIDRTLERFPPAEPPVPAVPHGTLFIVGGGGMPDGLMRQFVIDAGGRDARLVYVPCSEDDDVGERHGLVETWRQMGVRNATFIHTKDRAAANTDERILTPLREATGIWFGGGRQWNFSDSYYGTEAHRLMKGVLQRNGVIGGSSAGASIQARYLARATPIGNTRIMAPGYERGGLGFIGGVAIDQHFTQRGRQKDMTELMARHPQLLGIGIDEGTALVVRGSEARVVGAGRTYFYDRTEPVHPDRPDYLALPAGAVYDLAERRVVSDPDQGDDAQR